MRSTYNSNSHPLQLKQISAHLNTEAWSILAQQASFPQTNPFFFFIEWCANFEHKGTQRNKDPTHNLSGELMGNDIWKQLCARFQSFMLSQSVVLCQFILSENNPFPSSTYSSPLSVFLISSLFFFPPGREEVEREGGCFNLPSAY